MCFYYVLYLMTIALFYIHITFFYSQVCSGNLFEDTALTKD